MVVSEKDKLETDVAEAHGPDRRAVPRKRGLRENHTHEPLRGTIQKALGHLMAVLLLLGWAGMQPASGQVGRSVPKDGYYASKRAYYAGEYRFAERGFAQSLRSGIRIGQSRWIDSICYYSMLGEVYFHQGALARSLEFHELAIQVHLANTGWLSRIRYPVINVSTDRIQTRVNWGRRPTQMGDFPESMGSLEGTFDLQTPFQIGGAVNPAHVRAVDAVEVVRCLAVSLRRRAQLLGPTASLSRTSSRVTSSFANLSAPPGHWVVDWIEVLYGLALMGEGQRKEAVAHMANGAVSGNFDHPLTGTALLEIGKRHLRLEEYDLAVAQLHQASLAAALFRQADVVEEALRYLTDAFLANQGRGTHPALPPIVLYAGVEDFHRLAAAIRLGQAELAVYSNNPRVASNLLNESRVIMARQDLIPTDLGGRLRYLDALTQYRAGQTQAATQSMGFALAYMRRGSLKRFHLSLVEALVAGGRKSISPRNAEALYSIALREPSDVDWRTDPLETISMLLANSTGSIERWFALLISRRDYDEAVRVAEYLRRHRFYSTLPFGGRILSLRWLVEGDVAMLGTRGLEQQTALRKKYPRLAGLSRQAEKLRAQLRTMPVVPTDEDLQRVQSDKLDELESVSNELESLIRELALRREPAKLVFPPQPSLSALQRAMRQNQAILMFVTTDRGWHAWFIRKGNEDYWSIRSQKLVRRTITQLLRSIGNRDGNSVVAADDLVEDEAWKKPAAQLWSAIIGELPGNAWDGLDELVIIPDGPLWYLPFELLQVPAQQLPAHDEDQTLARLARIRYAPVVSLSVGDRQGHKQDLKTTIVGGKLSPRETSEPVGEMLVKLKAEFADLEIISKRKPPKTSKYTAGLFDRLIVWNDVSVDAKNAYRWAPAQYDRGARESSLADWMEYPWGAPDQLIVPGFHTAAERAVGARTNGHEVFLTACALMASGTRTALLSRWRTGGRTPTVLVREFAIGLPNAAASEAWRTAVELARVEPLDANTEPRVRRSEDESLELTANHPFFWAGYMLLDTGAEPAEEPPPEPRAEPPAEPPDEEAKPAEEPGELGEEQTEPGDKQGEAGEVHQDLDESEAGAQDAAVEP